MNFSSVQEEGRLGLYPGGDRGVPKCHREEPHLTSNGPISLRRKGAVCSVRQAWSHPYTSTGSLF